MIWGSLAVFIDGGYLEALQKHEFDVRLDVKKLVDEIQDHVEEASADKVELLRAYYYHCRPYRSDPPTPDEMDRYSNSRRFEDALRYLPRFEVRLGHLRMSGVDESGVPIFEQKQVDLLLGLDMALAGGQEPGAAHRAWLPGDGDFVPAVRVLKNEGIIVWLDSWSPAR